MVSAVCEKVERKTKPKRVRYKVPTYKKADKINQNIKKYKSNQKHIFRYKVLSRIYTEIAREVLQGQNLIPFDNIIFNKGGLNIYLNVYSSGKYDWYDNKHKRWKEFNGESFIIVEGIIQGTELLLVGERLKIHIELLRQLRQGVKLKKAVKIARKAGK